MESNKYFSEIHGKFGFGLMRLPMKGNEIDIPQVCDMVDAFIGAGLNYFDTAHGYHNGMSETAFRESVAKRYSRDKFLITDKLTDPYFHSEDDIRPFFEKQLEWCGVDYFDFYLMHAQGAINYEKFKRCRAYETAFDLKKEGKIRHVGISFHDTAEVLERILKDYPEIEIVQIQLNYLDYEDPAVQSRKLLEVCEKYSKPIVVMEPVKGGSLVRIPAAAAAVYDELGSASYASYALRFAAGFDQVAMVISGMSDLSQMNDNISFMADFRKLDERETNAVSRVCGIIKGLNVIPCTACRYCIEENHCPKDISIPDLFACSNTKLIFNDWNQNYYYNEVHTFGHGKASDCIQCGMCERVCPQHLPIREHLKEVAAVFE